MNCLVLCAVGQVLRDSGLRRVPAGGVRGAQPHGGHGQGHAPGGLPRGEPAADPGLAHGERVLGGHPGGGQGGLRGQVAQAALHRRVSGFECELSVDVKQDCIALGQDKPVAYPKRAHLDLRHCCLHLSALGIPQARPSREPLRLRSGRERLGHRVPGPRARGGDREGGSGVVHSGLGPGDDEDLLGAGAPDGGGGGREAQDGGVPALLRALVPLPLLRLVHYVYYYVCYCT